ncbi:UDP-N-acetylglucosamine 2-epimerase [Kitasatospora sp. NPDC004615]|uniref:UDP-N-acetylglucosamine 2-epimerase n=1 Tax=Kitasatospora sp. NPDC004615 TaxID=3364017 RepID=UPI0036C8A150
MDTGPTITVYLGARPNTPKVWTLQQAVGKMRTPGAAWTYVHTGQHFDPRLGQGLCDELDLHVDRWLRCGDAASDAEQIGRLCALVERDLDEHPAEAVVVVGDVNSTVAAALVAARRGTPVIHLEAGLRSPDRTPEEANRRIVTACTDHHLATTAEAVDALHGEGIPGGSVHFVGNPMAECHLAHHDPDQDAATLNRLGLTPGTYVLATLHKPAALSHPKPVLDVLRDLAAHGLTPVLPLHPRAAGHLAENGLLDRSLSERVLPPQPYLAFGALLRNCAFVVTDSDGVQEEAAAARVACLATVPGSAREVTRAVGSTHFADSWLHLPTRDILALAAGRPTRRPERWDSRVSDRIATALDGILPALPHRGVHPRAERLGSRTPREPRQSRELRESRQSRARTRARSGR